MEKKKTILVVGGSSVLPLSPSTIKELEDNNCEVVVVDSLPEQDIQEPFPLLEVEIHNPYVDNDLDHLREFEKSSPIFKPKRGKGKKGVKRKR